MGLEKLNLNFLGKSEQTFDPMEYGRYKAEVANRTEGNLTGYDCPKCRNRGNIALPQEDGSVSFRECGCMKIRRCVQKMEASGLRDVIRNYTFDAYKDTEEWQNIIKRGAMEYAENVRGWLLFCGQSGSGKTHLCTAVCRKLLLDGEEVRYMPWRQDAELLKDMKGDSARRGELKKALQNAPVLFIDDLYKVGRSADGSCNPTAGDVNLAFDIINFRYTKRLPTLVSTERTPTELVEIDEAVGGRIIEMANRHIYNVQKNQKRNYRLRSVVTV